MVTMDQSFQNLLIGIRQWVNGKLDAMSLVISSNINELFDTVATKQDVLTAGDNIEIVKASGVTTINVVDLPEPVASDFDIKDLADSTGLREEWSNKQDALTAGDYIEITEDASGNTVISASGIPTDTSDLTNSAGFVTLDEVVSGIIDDTTAATGKTYSSSKIAELISNLNQFNVVVVDTLPSAGTTHTLYFVPQAGVSGRDVMDEYMWIVDETTGEGQWELVGTTRIDLSDYYTSSQVDSLLDEKQDVLTAGNNITIDSGNTIDVPIATTSTLGVVKIGSGLAVDANGLVTIEEISVNEVLEVLNTPEVEP